MGADGIQSRLNIFVAAVNLINMVNTAYSVCRHGGNQHGNTRADIGRSHVIMLQAHLPVVPYHHCTVGVAEDNLRTHVNQFIYEEEAALEHLLVYPHRAACLRRHYQDNRQQVRCQSGPGRLGD